MSVFRVILTFVSDCFVKRVIFSDFELSVVENLCLVTNFICVKEQLVINLSAFLVARALYFCLE